MNSVINNTSAHRFESHHDGQIAVAEYHLEDKVMTITHTFVPSAWRGQGIGTDLVLAAIENARAQQLSIVPRCPFMATYFENHPEVQDVLHRE